MYVSAIFKDEPLQWGLRGDPLLWRDMAENLSGQEMPNTNIELEELLINTLESLTGESIESKEALVLDKYKNQGMSSGGISFSFWREKGIPLLVSRHAKT